MIYVPLVDCGSHFREVKRITGFSNQAHEFRLPSTICTAWDDQTMRYGSVKKEIATN